MGNKSGTTRLGFATPTEAAPAAVDVTGAWATDDGQLRIVLRPGGTFVEDFNGQEAAYEGLAFCLTV